MNIWGEYRSFANKKFAMEKDVIEKKFEQFAAVLDRGGATMGRPEAFGDICASLGLAEPDMDCYLRDNFGLSGQDIVRIYAGCIPLYLL